VTRCPRCGALVSSGLCPACLLATALTVDDGPCPYDVLAPMAEDAAGTTYFAQGLAGRRSLAALKIYRPRPDVTAVLDRYARWKPILDRFDHPHAARLLDVGLTSEGRLYKATEYFAGFPLTALLTSSTTATVTVDADVRRSLARQLASAVRAAHDVQLVHLDLTIQRVKAATSRGPHVMLLGLGSRAIFEGATGDPMGDVAGLVTLLRNIGVAVPESACETAAAVEQALATG